MILALLAPELLLFLAINERISAGILLKKALKFHPHLAKRGMLASNTHERAESIESTESKNVSANAITWTSDSL
jgi:hypothetical protein